MQKLLLHTRTDKPGQATIGQRTSTRSPTGGYHGSHHTFYRGQGWITFGKKKFPHQCPLQNVSLLNKLWNTI